MKTKIILFTGVVLCICFSGCRSSLERFRGMNRENIMKLSEGMTKAQVMEVMGTKTGGGKYGEPRVSNPYKSEIIIEDGVRYEVLYYYTDIDSSIYISNPSMVREGDLAPVILKDGKVAGWGRGFLTALTNDD